MSLNHIVKGGLKDLDLDVKSLSIQGQTVNPGGGGNPFDQSLNTTDAVEFASVNMQDLQSSGSLFIDVPAGVLTIVTPGININSNVINTNSTITTTKPLTLDNQLATKEQVEILIDTIVPDLINLQPLEQKVQNQSASSGITNFDGDIRLNGVSIKKTVVLFNQSIDYLVVNGGFYTDGYITLGWDATSQTEFLLNALPATGGVTVSSLNGGTGSSIVATQQNFKYDFGGSVLLNGMLQSWIHSNTDPAYPNYYVTIMKVGGGENSILTVEKY